MASIELINVRAALKKAHEEIDKAFAPILNAAAEADSEDENDAEVKLTPIQKLNKQLETEFLCFAAAFYSFYSATEKP